MSDKEEEFESIGDGPKEDSIKKADSDENIFKTTKKISALDIAWNFNDPSADAALTEYKEINLHYNDLSSLEDKDLVLLGVADETVRARMIKEFANLPNQEVGYETILKETDMVEYSNTVLSNISEHIKNLKISLMAAQIKFKVNPLEDVFLTDEKIYGSHLVLKTIEKMVQQCDEMHVMVGEIVGADVMANRKSQGLRKKIVKSMFWLGTIALATYAGQKLIRAKLK